MPDWLLTLTVAALAATGSLAATRYGRIARLEKRLAELETRERTLWVYTRDLIDHIYRGEGPPPPPPPPTGYYADKK
ncbi:arginyl-tRNA synthetase [Leifsonia xyli subsp. cynodontis DSM 46306]|uniref:Uncharacterized protein n=1 Tax=Leifsonia xyli subsp. cynodontis DSM 46306 TaxID=1389489 RepID=U3PFM4_LEIXC|nr:hypothetical protein [Leifsonia xyli]AGW42448.1 arginyl-tRNA synthetase [Leifsonia xyli subsp. cynodontis DSM 46306]